MKKTLILFLCSISFGVFGQTGSTKYFKDIALSKEVNERRASFKSVETTADDGVKTIHVFNIDENCLVRTVKYKDEVPCGIWVLNAEDCTTGQSFDFSRINYTSPENDSLFNLKQKSGENYQPAQFNGTSNGIIKYLSKNLEYPQEATQLDIIGTVFIKFIVNEDGSTKVVSVARSAHPILDYAAWMTIENMPNWTPARENGTPVKSYQIIPIRILFR